MPGPASRSLAALTLLLALALAAGCGGEDGPAGTDDATPDAGDAGPPDTPAPDARSDDTNPDASARDTHDGDPDTRTFGALRVRLDRAAGTLTVTDDDRTLATLDLSAVAFRSGSATYEMKFGMFRIVEEAGDWITAAPAVPAPSADDGADGDDDALRFALVAADDRPLADVVVTAPADGHVLVTVTTADEAWNRARLALDCAPDDHFAGLGAQSHDVDHRGQIVPLWVSEQGIGKRDDDEYPVAWFLTGRRHTTHAPIPAVVTSRGTAWALETDAFARFDLCATDEERVTLEAWEGTLRYHLFAGPTPLAALGRLTAWTGRPPLPAPWAFAPWNDAIRGSDDVRAFAETLRAEGLPSSAIWSEDWGGGDWYGDDYRNQNDWWLDPATYPDAEALIANLNALGIQWQLYFNTFVYEANDVWDEALALGHVIVDTAGEPIVFPSPNATFKPAALVDLTSPEARDWVKSFLVRALDLGARGWMADYAEWMPVDDVALASGEDPALVHNRYPILWQEVNRDAIAEAGLADEVVVYFRSAWLGSQPLVGVMWAGDQSTSFLPDDGLPTVVPIGLGLAATGFPFFTHDIAGYQSTGVTPTTKELFFRWTALGAYTPIMRTHHGISVRENWDLASDAETTAHWKRYAELHVRLYPYLRALAVRSVETGEPPWIPLGLLYPADETAWPLRDQFQLGRALLVAPVVTEGATSRDVYLPAGRWTPFPGGGEAVAGPTTVTVDAPVDAIPVFLAAGGVVPLTDAPAQTLLAGVDGVPGLETTEGDRVVYVGLGAPGRLVEESGASYTLEGDGTDLAGLELAADGAVVIEGDGVIEGGDFTLRLEGHPTDRTTRVYLR